jgi:ribosomal protein S27AE
MANYNHGEHDADRSCPNCLSNNTFEDEDDNLHCENCLYVEEEDN